MKDMTPHQIDQLLMGARIGRLCMAGEDGRPYVIPIPFCWSGGSIYLRLPLTGRKGRVLTENDRVCFEVDYFTDALDDYGSVLVEGTLVAVSDLAEKAHVRSINTEKYQRLRGGYRPGHGRQTPLEALPMRKILVQSLSGKINEPQPAVAAGA